MGKYLKRRCYRGFVGKQGVDLVLYRQLYTCERARSVLKCCGMLGPHTSLQSIYNLGSITTSIYSLLCNIKSKIISENFAGPFKALEVQPGADGKLV